MCVKIRFVFQKRVSTQLQHHLWAGKYFGSEVSSLMSVLFKRRMVSVTFDQAQLNST